MQIKSARIFARAVAGLILVMLGCGFAYIKNTSTGLPIKWPAGQIVMTPGTIPMRIYPENTTVLTDGNTQASSIQAAMQDPSRGWNQNLGDVQFTNQVLAVGGSGMDNNGINEIFFSPNVYGMAFGTDGTLAVTTAWYSGNQRVEADIIFNTTYTWDSYRGALHGGNLEDLQRVVLHELGHVLGLDHPDDAGQTVTAIMNSHISNLDSLAADDIAGGQSLYGPPGTPANNNFANAIAITLVNNAATVTGYNTMLYMLNNPPSFPSSDKEAGEPNHAGNIGGRSVWWKWTAPSSGMATLTTQGSVFDTTLGVYVGPAVNSLTTIASNDDVQPGMVQYSSVTFTATGGVTYYFGVDGFNASDGNGADSGAVTLNLSLTSSGTTTTSTTSTSTSSTIPPTPGGGGGGGGAPSVWFFGALSLLACARRMFPKKG